MKCFQTVRINFIMLHTLVTIGVIQSSIMLNYKWDTNAESYNIFKKQASTIWMGWKIWNFYFFYLFNSDCKIISTGGN